MNDRWDLSICNKLCNFSEDIEVRSVIGGIMWGRLIKGKFFESDWEVSQRACSCAIAYVSKSLKESLFMDNNWGGVRSGVVYGWLVGSEGRK